MCGCDKVRAAWAGEAGLNGLPPASRWLCLWFLLGWLSSPQAILFYNTGDPAFNTNAPSGSLAGSGWQYEGRWSSFLGTAIGPHHFITAKHVGGTVGDPYYLDGVAYDTKASFAHPQADLRIWRVGGTLPRYAELYAHTNETGRALVIFGRGGQRGDPVTIPSLFGRPMKGWRWGKGDGVQRWGENQVAFVMQMEDTGAEVLEMAFSGAGGANHAGMSSGDSGGAIFIRDGATWKLAGINWAVAGPFNTSDTGDGFNATLFDIGGLYQKSDSQWVLVPELSDKQPAPYFATRISSYVGWIQQILSQAIPADPPILVSAEGLNGVYARESGVVADISNQTIRITPSASPRFYRLQDSVPRRIESITVQGGQLTITYR